MPSPMPLLQEHLSAGKSQVSTPQPLHSMLVTVSSASLLHQPFTPELPPSPFPTAQLMDTSLQSLVTQLMVQLMELS